MLPAIVFRYYAPGFNALVLYDLNHLQKLVLRGDHLESFHNTWNMVLSELSEPPYPKLLQYLYFQPLQHFKPLVEDIAHYKMAKYLGSSDYSFEWLREASNRYLLMKERLTCKDHLVGDLTESLARPRLPLILRERVRKAKAKIKERPTASPPTAPKAAAAPREPPGAAPPALEKAKENNRATHICYAYQEGTCTRGK